MSAKEVEEDFKGKTMKMLETKLNQKSIDEFIQILVGWYWMALFVFVPTLTGFLVTYIAFFTSYYLLIIVYLCWAYCDKETPYKGGRRAKSFRNCFHWYYFIRYFPIKVVKTADLSLDKNYLLGYFPHGVMPAGMLSAFGSDTTDFVKLFPGLITYCAVLDLNFHIPLWREHSLAMGGISCCKESLTYVLGNKKKGNAVALAIGGATESFYAKPGPYRIVLKNRKGFVKIALQSGADLVPTFGFGEIDLFLQNNPPGSMLRTFQEWFKRIVGVVPCWVQGRGIFFSSGIVPLKKPVTVVVGKAIQVPKIDEPTVDDIDKYHSLFVEALVELFNEHKSKYAEEGDESQLFIE